MYPPVKVKEKNNFLSGLLIYFGLLQLIHITLLILSLYIYLHQASLAWLVPPPKVGWSAQTVHLLLGMGIADALNVGLSFYFLYCFFTHKKTWLSLGLMNLAIVHFSALVFGYAILSTGAWAVRPGHYGSMTLLLLPVTVLFVVLLQKVVPSH